MLLTEVNGTTVEKMMDLLSLEAGWLREPEKKMKMSAARRSPAAKEPTAALPPMG